MKLTPVLVITTIVGIVLGVGFILIPGTLMDLFLEDVGFTVEHELLTRLYGSATLFVGLVALVGLWFDRVKEQRLVAYALMGFMFPQAGLFTYGTLTGGINSMGWILVGVAGIQALLYSLTLLRSES